MSNINNALAFLELNLGIHDYEEFEMIKKAREEIWTLMDIINYQDGLSATTQEWKLIDQISTELYDDKERSNNGY